MTHTAYSTKSDEELLQLVYMSKERCTQLEIELADRLEKATRPAPRDEEDLTWP